VVVMVVMVESVVGGGLLKYLLVLERAFDGRLREDFTCVAKRWLLSLNFLEI
jgi:hypothetical protein